MHEIDGDRTEAMRADAIPSSPAAPQFKYFLHLPAEIRLKIYDLVLEPLGERIRPRTYIKHVVNIPALYKDRSYSTALYY
jgi:hypothetical protein